jgi:hypothetical protein
LFFFVLLLKNYLKKEVEEEKKEKGKKKRKEERKEGRKEGRQEGTNAEGKRNSVKYLKLEKGIRNQCYLPCTKKPVV